MSNHFNKLTPAEAERLALLAEEMGEAIQVIGKILRHGYESTHPDDEDTTNRELLARELGDVRYCISLLCRSDDLDKNQIRMYADSKADRVDEYLHHQEIAS